MKKLLITGINGFVGSNFVKSWKDKLTLYGLDINQTLNEGVEKIFSWEELENIPQVNAVIHLAGLAADTADESLMNYYMQVNFGLTKKIFDWFMPSDACTFIHFSSVKAVVPSLPDNLVTEDTATKPAGPYGLSKMESEKYLLEHLPKAANKGKKIFILRPAMIYGKGNKGNLNTLYKFVSKGIPWPFGAYENRRSFCAIDNVAFVVDSLIKKSVTVESGVYNVCDDEALSTNELVALIANVSGKKVRIWKIPKKMWGVLSSIGTIVKIPFNKMTLEKLTENYIVDNSKIKQALNISEMPHRVTDSLTKTIKSFKQA